MGFIWDIDIDFLFFFFWGYKEIMRNTYYIILLFGNHI